MTEIKPTVDEIKSAQWNKELMNAVKVAKSSVTSGRELHIEMGPNGLAVVKSGMKCGVANGIRMVLDIEFESVTLLENGWMVACKHGIYDVYDKEGNVYRGLSFLKKRNAIKFASEL